MRHRAIGDRVGDDALMAFSAIHDLIIDERHVRIYSNGAGRPVLTVPDLG